MLARLGNVLFWISVVLSLGLLEAGIVRNSAESLMVALMMSALMMSALRGWRWVGDTLCAKGVMLCFGVFWVCGAGR